VSDWADIAEAYRRALDEGVIVDEGVIESIASAMANQDFVLLYWDGDAGEMRAKVITPEQMRQGGLDP
jgi:hypothetical protein